jgi:predicted TIM-barrel fold metal-dependent hydrolase
MKMEDMVVVSVDDHVCEPGDMFDRHLSGEALATAPKLRTKSTGTQYWEYQGIKMPSVALNAVTGRVREEYGFEPTAYEQVRKGCWDVHARIGDMDVNGIAASLNFGSIPQLDGLAFCMGSDKTHAVKHVQAYNDWHMHEWCGAYPGRLIPCGIIPAWDMDATVAEIARLKKLGCNAISFNENPTKRGLPSVHNAYWEPMWKALADNEVTINLHIGGGNAAPHATDESPIEAWITTMPMSVAIGAADWLNLAALNRYPSLQIVLSESGIGWIPYFLERADYTHYQHKAWTHSEAYFKGSKPSEVYKRHFSSCFIDDAYGCRNLDLVGEDNVCYEVDYPHSDAPWPDAPEILWRSVKQLTDAQIDKVTHGNAMRLYKFPLFERHKREELTVAALRAKANAAGVSTALYSSGGAAPLKAGEEPRPVTSADVVAMFVKQAQVV